MLPSDFDGILPSPHLGVTVSLLLITGDSVVVRIDTDFIFGTAPG